MSYIGLPPKATFSSGLLDRFTSTTGTTVTLTHDIASENDIVGFVNFVKQDSTTYSVGGTGNKTLTLGGTLVSSDIVEVHYLNIVGQTNAPSSGSVTTATINDNAVTGAKLNTDVISAQTELASAPDSTDELLISDAGVLKRVDVSLVGGDNTPSFLVKLSANVTNQTANSTVKAPYNTEVYDTDNAFDNSSNYRFTVPSGEGGKYFIFMHQNIREEGQNDNYQYLTARLYKNGSFYTEGQRAFGGNNLAANFNNTASFGIIMELAASDYLEFYIKVYNSPFIFMEEGSYAGGYKLIGV